MLNVTPKDPSTLTFNSDFKLILLVIQSPQKDLNTHMVVFGAQ